MRFSSHARLAVMITVAAVGGLLTSSSRPFPAVAAPPARHFSAATAESATTAQSAAAFPSVAVVRGADNAVWATTGGGFFSLGGRTFDDPAVAAAPPPPAVTPTPTPTQTPTQVASAERESSSSESTTVGITVGPLTVAYPYRFFYLSKGADGLLWIRTDIDSGWHLVTGAGKAPGHVAVGTSLTAAFQPQTPTTPPAVVFSYLDANSLTHLGVIAIGAVAPFALTLTSDVTGPPASGAAVNSSGRPLFVDGDYFPSQLGPGTLEQWDGTSAGAATPTRVGLNCAPDRLGTTLGGAGAVPFNVVACRGGLDDSVHFLGRNGASGLGYGTAHDLGGHIIGSPGIALENTFSVSSVVYVTGTDHRVWAAKVTDLGGIFHASGWTLIGGVARGGVQASSWSQ
jgi:hypothetical protein